MTLPALEPLTGMDERLRQVPIDIDLFAVALAAWEAERDTARLAGDRDRLRRALGVTGTACRILRRWDDAERDLTEARALATGARVAAADIRLAELDRCRDRLAASIGRLENVLAGLAEHAPLRSFALQHLGKAFCDAGRAAEAITVLEAALASRERLGDASLIASTQQALDRARRYRIDEIERSGSNI